MVPVSWWDPKGWWWSLTRTTRRTYWGDPRGSPVRRGSRLVAKAGVVPPSYLEGGL
jgi:hypothetical protein